MVYEKHAGPTISRPSDMVPVLSAILDTEDEIDGDKEHLYAIGLNEANRVIYVELVTLGLINQSCAHPREIFRRAIMSACSSIIIGHNHPSGKIDPSRQDNEVTERIKAAGGILGIELLDHIIVTGSGYYSYSEHGTL